ACRRTDVSIGRCAFFDGDSIVAQRAGSGGFGLTGAARDRFIKVPPKIQARGLPKPLQADFAGSPFGLCALPFPSERDARPANLGVRPVSSTLGNAASQTFCRVLTCSSKARAY